MSRDGALHMEQRIFAAELILESDLFPGVHARINPS
jgi:hypothetical protein